MFAVTLYKNGELVQLMGFVNSVEEYEDFATKFAAHNGGEESLLARGYKLCAELAF